MKIGIDLTLVSRFRRKERMFAERILTEDERAEYVSRSEAERVRYLAERWAAKEAVFKATGDTGYLGYSVLGAGGAAYVKDKPNIDISIGGDGDTVVAVAISKNIL